MKPLMIAVSLFLAACGSIKDQPAPRTCNQHQARKAFADAMETGKIYSVRGMTMTVDEGQWWRASHDERLELASTYACAIYGSSTGGKTIVVRSHRTGKELARGRPADGDLKLTM